MIALLLLLASVASAQEVSTGAATSLLDEVRISNLGKDTRDLLSGRYRQTGKPTFANGFCFGDATCQTTAGYPSGSVSQMKFCVFTGTGTSTASIPDDDTIPQSGEGVQIYTCSFTPKSATSTLIIQAVTQIASEANNAVYVCLFQDAATDAAACAETSNLGSGSVGGGSSNVITYSAVSGTTSEITFKIRGGSNGGTAWGWNVRGFNGASILGFKKTSAIIISEVAP